MSDNNSDLGLESSPVRQVLLAWIGAVALVQDHWDGWFEDLVERGQSAEQVGRRFVAERRNARGASVKSPKPSILSRGLDGLLSGLGRPTRQETSAITERITRLEERIRELGV